MPRANLLDGQRVVPQFHHHGIIPPIVKEVLNGRGRSLVRAGEYDGAPLAGMTMNVILCLGLALSLSFRMRHRATRFRVSLKGERDSKVSDGEKPGGVPMEGAQRTFSESRMATSMILGEPKAHINGTS